MALYQHYLILPCLFLFNTILQSSIESSDILKTGLDACNWQFYRSNYPAALACFKQQFAQQHQFDAQTITNWVNYAETVLATGDYINGFKLFDWRLHLINPRDKFMRIAKLQNAWDGSNPEGKHIVVYCEQGLGDTFFFSRYIKVLHRLGAKVTVVVQGPLKGIIKQSFAEVADIITGNEPLPEFDYDVYMMSLPRYVSAQGLKPTTIETIPQEGSYIKPSETLKNDWQKKLAHDKNIKIGICWAAGPMPAGQARKLERDIPVELLAQLSKIEGVSVYSLQGGDRENDLNALPKDLKVFKFDTNFDRVRPGQEYTGPFQDTAALIDLFDIIISVDTSTGCLAGAIRGNNPHKPTFILLPYEADWRWLENNRTDSPWYPAVHIMRQPTQGEWNSVAQQLYQEIQKIVKNKLQ